MFVINIIILSLFVLLLLRIIIKAPIYSGVFIYLGVLQFWYLISNIYLNLGQWDPKLNISTSENYSVFFLAIVYVTFNYSLFSFFRKKEFDYQRNKITTIPSVQKLQFGITISIVVLFFMIAPIFIVGIPIFSNLNKREYYEVAEKLGLSIFLRYHFFIPILIGSIELISKKINSLSLIKIVRILLYTYFIVLFLIGNKFTAIFFGFVLYLLASDNTRLLINSIKLKKTKIFKLIGYILIVSILFAIVIYFQSNLYHTASFVLFDYLVHRVLISQSSLWWASWDDVYNNTIDLSTHLNRELTNTFFRYDDKFKIGHYFLMLKHGGMKAYYFSKSGFVYTGGYPAILLYIMPKYMVVLFQVPIAYIFGNIIYELRKNTIKLDILGVAIIIQFLSSFFSFFWMGNIHYFFSRRNLLLLLILILYKQYIRPK